MDELAPGMRLRLSTASEVRAVHAIGYAQARLFEARWSLTEADQFAWQAGRSAHRSSEEAVVRLEFAGLQQVYDIQTLSGQYLSNNIVVHNCFILSIEDDLVNEGGIMDLITREARLFKYGSGTGTNYSNLRASSEPLRGGGVSSGLLSFLKVSDRSASSIKSGGTTRRAARMVTLDADHPDVFRYIDWKAEEERKVAAMVTGSKILRRHTKRILEACRPRPEDNGNGRGLVRSPQEQGPGARREGGAAGRGARLLGAPGDPACRAGRLGLRAGGVHHGLGQRGVQHGERPVLQQLAAPHRHVHGRRCWTTAGGSWSTARTARPASA